MPMGTLTCGRKDMNRPCTCCISWLEGASRSTSSVKRRDEIHWSSNQTPSGLLMYFNLKCLIVALAVCLKIFVLLKGDLSPQAQDFCSLQQSFFQDCPVFSFIHLSNICDQLPSTF
ncbi:hypothetical protein AMECASPLE_019585 [Ameca splendens]|uniref:Uncharacterized protein n=1 Tax=Ameca splendens TaxID=208324 RepID=A0ABV0YEZ7_9TELE